jgi:hypothetical protein
MGVFIMYKNQLMAVMNRASGISAKTAMYSLGAVAVSLSVNLVNLDSNSAVAGTLSFENFGSITAAIPAATDVINGDLSIGDTENPIIFASEIFGANSASTGLPKTGLMGVRYEFDGSIDASFNAKFSLDNGAKFKAEPELNCAATGGTGPTVSTATQTPTAVGSNTVTFAINADATTGEPISTGVSGGSDSYSCKLVYSISNAQALATPGQKITMTATMMTAQPSYPVSPERSVVIAESKSAVSVDMITETSVDSQDDRISVASGNTEFAYTTDGTSKATIGYLLVKDVNVDGSAVCNAALLATSQTAIKDATGALCFNVTKVNSDKTVLTITDGQFKASTTSPGAVALESTLNSTDSISVQAVDETTAIFKLDGSDMTLLTTKTKQGDNGFAIKIVADGKTDINVNENPPTAELHIEYDDLYYTDYAAITYPAVELRKIKQDGTRCVVYNVPAPGSADIVAVRITNDSGVDGIVNATLYDGSGAEIFAAQPLNGGEAIKKGATLAVFADNLAALGSWTGRGVLVLTTTLPNIEVLGLLREANNNAAPLTNLSTGASGSGCTN